MLGVEGLRRIGEGDQADRYLQLNPEQTKHTVFAFLLLLDASSVD